MTATDIVDLALAFYRDPLAYQGRFVATSPLPPGVGRLLGLAHGGAPVLTEAARQRGARPAEVQDAARFLIQQLCFARGAGHYRTLGLEPDASFEQIKEHHRRLMWLFHPDRAAGRDPWTDGYAARLNDAWDTLSRPESRVRYDTGLQQRGLQSGGGRRATGRSPLLFRSRPRQIASRPIYAQRQRWLPILVLGGCSLLAALLVGVNHWLRPAAVPLVYAARPAVLTAPDQAVRAAELKWAQEQRERIAATVKSEQDQRFDLLVQTVAGAAERLRLERLRQEQDAAARRAQLALPSRAEPPRVPSASPLLVVPVEPVARVSQAATPTPAVDRNPETAGLTAMAPAPPRKMKVAGTVAVPPPPAPPIGEGEVERAPDATLTVTDRDVERLVKRYTRAYQRADLNAVMRLFAPGTRDRDGGDLRRGYAATFAAYEIRELRFYDLDWGVRGDTAKVFASYELRLRQRTNGQLSQLGGTIRLGLHKHADRVVIDAIDYQWRAN
ncbi:DnaJ domain-containing protein [uncultured Thiodictyon sp.]|uniref:DnaJ domain-containing protein n=1 Tax=uncultured Thiodictyon sp. TaxID=1846217 RepID=UPI0025CC3DE9|nr:DnaJ domain-containing protein [uncultured Thiodictyon sp.]